MLRFFLGFLFGLILTLFSLGFIGVGHGTYVPMAFSGSLIAMIASFTGVIATVLVPFLWASYFLVIPRIRARSARLTSVIIVLSLHLASGIWLAIQDAAFVRVLYGQRRQLLSFALVLIAASTGLLYFALRRSRTTKV